MGAVSPTLPIAVLARLRGPVQVAALRITTLSGRLVDLLSRFPTAPYVITPEPINTYTTFAPSASSIEGAFPL